MGAIALDIKLTLLREKLAKLELDGLLITGAQNRRYVTGFTGTAGVVLISQEDARFITDFRYVQQAKQQAIGFQVITFSDCMYEELNKQIREMGIERLGYEEEHVTCAVFRKMQEKLKTPLVPTTKLVEKLREIKNDQEIKLLKEAAYIADKAFNHITNVIKPGLSELEIADELEFFMRREGAESSSFQMIIASGERSALPHGVASKKLIESGDMLKLDFGALYNGYRSDITRTVAVGEPNKELKKVYSIVQGALEHCVKHLKPNMSCKEADALARNYIEESGYGPNFGHGTGHGIGLDIHEEPFLSRKSESVLKEGMVVTIEPGIYLPDIGGVRIEDDVLILSDGVERITHSNRNLIIL